MPKLWNQTIETHRLEVRQAILNTTAELVAEHGLLSVTMSEIAERTGIGRATLYKYFPDVEAILLAWHEQLISRHLQELARIREKFDDPARRLHAVLEAYALIQRERVSRHHTEPYGSELAVFLHRDPHLAAPQEKLHEMIRELLAEAVDGGHVRSDVSTGELATYCLNALQAAGSLTSEAAVRRLVTVTLAGMARQSD